MSLIRNILNKKHMKSSQPRISKRWGEQVITTFVAEDYPRTSVRRPVLAPKKVNKQRGGVMDVEEGLTNLKKLRFWCLKFLFFKLKKRHKIHHVNSKVIPPLKDQTQPQKILPMDKQGFQMSVYQNFTV